MGYYDRCYCREALANKCLDWFLPNTRWYNEACHARTIPCCTYCLQEDHASFMPSVPLCAWHTHSPTHIQSNLGITREVHIRYNDHPHPTQPGHHRRSTSGTMMAGVVAQRARVNTSTSVWNVGALIQSTTALQWAWPCPLLVSGSLVPGINSKWWSNGGKNTWIQLFAHVQTFPRNLENCIILVLMATFSDSDDDFSSALW